VHLDGLEKTHDIAVEREGVFREAIEGIRAAKKAGFLVCTNTTVFAETDMNELDELFAFLQGLGVDGHMLSPAYSYQAVKVDEIFMDRAMIHRKFRQNADTLFKKYRLMTSPVYLEFLKGERDMQCTAWGNPTRNVRGWKGPCYLITDTHHDTFNGLMQDTPWEKYGHGRDPRCENCMVHAGYEASAVVGVNRKISDMLKMAVWQMT
jgi:hopanoid biosynthesis associated radical SAM protein HpnH